MDLEILYKKALKQEFLTATEGLFLYENAPTSDLMFIGNELRKLNQPKEKTNKVAWIIDRNVNITNVCIAQCEFCNFYRRPAAPDIYITTLEEYDEKIKVLKELGGNQLLMQGGLHPKLGLDYYKKLFSDLKKNHPDIKLHALGPAEIHHIARISKTTYKDVLVQLTKAGLDSLPGAGAEILVDRVRKTVSRGKCTAKQWLDVMREAHKLNIVTSATMMFGHIETKKEQLEHLIRLSEVQNEKPDGNHGFVTFVPWPFMDEGTVLRSEGIRNTSSANDYLRLIAMSRIMLNNVKNIQASWLTAGAATGQLCLHGGANDFGSIMMEENVVSAAGANYKLDANGIQQAIRDAGFEPQYRNQAYENDRLAEGNN